MPKPCTVVRTTTIDAPAERIHALVCDFVDWRMHGELSGAMRLLSLVKSMDSLVGPDVEKGLARLKRVAESEAPPGPQPPPG